MYVLIIRQWRVPLHTCCSYLGDLFLVTIDGPNLQSYYWSWRQRRLTFITIVSHDPNHSVKRVMRFGICVSLKMQASIAHLYQNRFNEILQLKNSCPSDLQLIDHYSYYHTLFLEVMNFLGGWLSNLFNTILKCLWKMLLANDSLLLAHKRTYSYQFSQYILISKSPITGLNTDGREPG